MLQEFDEPVLYPWDFFRVRLSSNHRFQASDSPTFSLELYLCFSQLYPMITGPPRQTLHTWVSLIPWRTTLSRDVCKLNWVLASDLQLITSSSLSEDSSKNSPASRHILHLLCLVLFPPLYLSPYFIYSWTCFMSRLVWRWPEACNSTTVWLIEVIFKIKKICLSLSRVLTLNVRLVPFWNIRVLKLCI